MQGISIARKPLESVPLSGDGRLGMTMPCVHSRGKQHRANSTNKEEWPSQKIRKTRDFKECVGFVHSPSYADYIDNTSRLREASLASLPHRLLLSLWQRHQCPASPLWALVCSRGFCLLERHSKSVLCRGRV